MQNHVVNIVWLDNIKLDIRDSHMSSFKSWQPPSAPTHDVDFVVSDAQYLSSYLKTDRSITSLNL